MIERSGRIAPHSPCLQSFAKASAKLSTWTAVGTSAEATEANQEAASYLRRPGGHGDCSSALCLEPLREHIQTTSALLFQTREMHKAVQSDRTRYRLPLPSEFRHCPADDATVREQVAALPDASGITAAVSSAVQIASTSGAAASSGSTLPRERVQRTTRIVCVGQRLQSLDD